VDLLADGVRSTNDAFRDEIEAILDRILPIYLPPDRVVPVRASEVTADFDWWSIGERLAAIIGEPLAEGQMSAALSDDPISSWVASPPIGSGTRPRTPPTAG
jgi:hypothetical protein